MRRIILKEEDLPKSDDERFWSSVDSDEVKLMAIFHIISEADGTPVEGMSDNECRSVLSRIQAHLKYLIPTQ
jgi:hypothetical protein